MSAAETKRIAALNDELRRQCGGAARPDQVNGVMLLTSGVMALAPEQIVAVWKAVRTFDAFTPDNDPYGERDFGAFTLAGGGKLFWKIDYFSDATCQEGSDDPADPAQCFRILTVMLAEEY